MWACLSEESTGWVFGSVRPLPVRRPWSRAALPEGATSPRSWWCGGAEDVLSGCSPSGDASFSVLPVSSLARACSCVVGQLIGMNTSRIATHRHAPGIPRQAVQVGRQHCARLAYNVWIRLVAWLERHDIEHDGRAVDGTVLGRRPGASGRHSDADPIGTVLGQWPGRTNDQAAPSDDVGRTGHLRTLPRGLACRLSPQGPSRTRPHRGEV